MKAFLAILFISFSVVAQSQTLSDFSLHNVRDGKIFKLADVKGDKGLAIIFVSNECPFDKFYEGRINELEQEYGNKGISFILVNAHLEPEENFETMKVRSKGIPATMPYLADKEKVFVKMLGASRSPEVFLFKKSNGKYTLFYKGAIDNNPQVAEDVKEQYLKDNLENILLNKPADHQGTRPAGCRFN